MIDKIKFTKMHGAGNDYIYVDTEKFPIDDPQQKAILWSDRHKGIGSDGLVLIGRSDIADFSMRIFNADGSEATMCGNATRCIGKYVYEKGLTDKEEIELETLSGIKILKLQVADGIVQSVTVDMGDPKSITSVELGADYHFTGTSVDMGNPHLVIFVNDIKEIDLPVTGPELETHPLFPGRVNVEFAQVLDHQTIRMRVWERGSGITLACGTGACATATAAIATQRIKGRKANIIMDGGALTIEWDEATGHIYMTGPATTVFEGEIIQ